MPARIRIISADGPFADAIGRWLRAWGVSVAIDDDFARVTPAVAGDERLDLVLLDVRRCEGGLLGWLSGLTRALPALEVILLGAPGQVATSIAAMRAGASTELSAPLDVAALRSAGSAALRRRRKRLARARPSLLERFERAMSAATFAQAGEFETARQLLVEPAKRRGGDRTAATTTRGGAPGREDT